MADKGTPKRARRTGPPRRARRTANPATLSFTTGGAPPKTLGNTAVGSLVDDTDSNHLNGSRITTGASAVPLTSLSVHVGPVGAAPNDQYQPAVYSDAVVPFGSCRRTSGRR
ncbi:hypothetical protein [Kitasatospora sp. NPDC056181]|uniref:hypothetical protein n=1 Tax=Kitasatospora sp. NPDC056181 TaxID=3345737 RepID=UPI0035DAE7F8